MSEEEKQVIEEVQYFITNGIDEARPFPIDDWCEILLSIIEKQQKEIKIQEDMIDEMVCELSTEGYLDDVCQMKQDNDECDDCCNLCIKEYFRKKVERK